jgi:small conductance mechanosensitive channel
VDWQNTAAGLGLSIAIALVVAQIASRLVRSTLAAVTGSQNRNSFSEPITRRPIRVVRAVVFVVILGLATRPVLNLFDVDLTFGVPLEELTAWLFAQGLRVVLIGLLGYFTVRVAELSINHFEEIVRARAGDNADKIELVERVHTISGLVTNAVNIIVLSVASLMMLQELGVNITPLLTGAGIAGLAVGFGAQNLVRDVISGFFFILEDQVHVGDVVEVNGTSGLVEAVKLRTLVLRDLSGTVHVVPNGEITTLSNKTKVFSYAVLDIGVAYKEDTDHVSAVLQDVGAELESDSDFSDSILASLEILGVNEFGDSAVVIKIRIKTRPLKQWMIGRELRRRIKKAFDTEGIEIPFPHMSLYFGEASKPFLAQQVEPRSLPSFENTNREIHSPSKSRKRVRTADSESESDGGFE